MDGDAAEQVVRSQTASAGGHAWLVRADAATRGRVPTAPPLQPGVAALSRRIKHGFDPQDVLGQGPFALAAAGPA